VRIGHLTIPQHERYVEGSRVVEGRMSADLISKGDKEEMDFLDEWTMYMSRRSRWTVRICARVWEFSVKEGIWTATSVGVRGMRDGMCYDLGL
jgi:hypothetical protein